MKAPLYTQDGTKKGEVELPAHLFAAEIKPHLIHLALLRQHAHARIASAHTLKRDEVSGTTKKGFKQKGTGNARMGNKTSPTRRGGGIAWGPRNDRNYEQMMPKKMRRGALVSALSSKAADGKIAVLDSFQLDAPKTKEFLKLKGALPANRSVLVIHNDNVTLAKSSGNVEYVKPLHVRVLNIHDLTKYDQILIEKSALDWAAETIVIEKKAKAAA